MGGSVMDSTKIKRSVWDCRIGPFIGKLPSNADIAMRKAVKRAYKEITGEDAPNFFSGWGGDFSPLEHEIIREDTTPHES